MRRYYVHKQTCTNIGAFKYTKQIQTYIKGGLNKIIIIIIVGELTPHSYQWTDLQDSKSIR